MPRPTRLLAGTTPNSTDALTHSMLKRSMPSTASDCARPRRGGTSTPRRTSEAPQAKRRRPAWPLTSTPLASAGTRKRRPRRRRTHLRARPAVRSACPLVRGRRAPRRWGERFGARAWPGSTPKFMLDATCARTAAQTAAGVPTRLDLSLRQRRWLRARLFLARAWAWAWQGTNTGSAQSASLRSAWRAQTRFVRRGTRPSRREARQ
mmetsp:Transcript_40987/g.101522  ORF Transcript_40987/g.101522 Transcript_40987/m.101522 type:complete len:207 (-) Transcript_40987:113-733(-)